MFGSITFYAIKKRPRWVYPAGESDYLKNNHFPAHTPGSQYSACLQGSRPHTTWYEPVFHAAPLRASLTLTALSEKGMRSL